MDIELLIYCVGPLVLVFIILMNGLREQAKKTRTKTLAKTVVVLDVQARAAHAQAMEDAQAQKARDIQALSLIHISEPTRPY